MKLLRYTNLTTKSVFVILLSVCVFSCTKGALVGPADANSLNAAKGEKGYIIVSCQNCMVQYGMPDQYKTFNTSGTSQKATFSYTPGYTLVTYVTALGQSQSLTLSVYNKNNVAIYQGTVTQPTTGYWSASVPLTDTTTTTGTIGLGY